MNLIWLIYRYINFHVLTGLATDKIKFPREIIEWCLFKPSMTSECCWEIEIIIEFHYILVCFSGDVLIKQSWDFFPYSYTDFNCYLLLSFGMCIYED